MKGVEEVKYMRGEEERLNARNQENTVRERERERERTPPSRVASWLETNTHKQPSIFNHKCLLYIFSLPLEMALFLSKIERC